MTVRRGGWCSNDVNGSYRVGFGLEGGFIFIFVYTRFELGDGSKIRF
jgi:hypothetical protein